MLLSMGEYALVSPYVLAVLFLVAIYFSIHALRFVEPSYF